MNLKTYQAYSMAEALAAVKRDLGADAVILNTRTFKRGGILGIGRRTIVEVTATPAADAARRQSAARTAKKQVGNASPGRASSGVSVESPQPATTSAHASAINPQAKRAYATVAARADASDVAVDERTRTQRLAQALAEQHERKQRAAQQITTDTDTPDTADLSNEASTPSAVGVSSTLSTDPAKTAVATTAAPASSNRTGADASAEVISVRPRRFMLDHDGDGHDDVSDEADRDDDAASSLIRRYRLVDPDDASTSLSVPQTTRDDGAASMQEELSAIRDMVGQVLQRQVRPEDALRGALPDELFNTYLRLIEQELSEELADQIVSDVRDELSADDMVDVEQIRMAVGRHLEQIIPVAEAPTPSVTRDGRALTIALVGPTGVGKTTTVAKLAASFKLRHGKSVGLITLDTYRIAAVDQLRTYANIIGLPLEIALTPADMKQATHRLAGCDVIIIDTAGRGQNDTRRIDELREFLEAARPHEVHLVLSGTASEKVLMREADAFSAVGVDKVVLTKLDEAVSFGMLVSVVRRIGKELSFITTGQEVPDHIEPGNAPRLAHLVMGGAI